MRRMGKKDGPECLKAVAQRSMTGIWSENLERLLTEAFEQPIYSKNGKCGLNAVPSGIGGARSKIIRKAAR